jgi:hypothetical protein
MGQQFLQVIEHELIGDVGCPVASAGFLAQQLLRGGEQRPTKTVFPPVLVHWITSAPSSLESLITPKQLMSAEDFVQIV